MADELNEKVKESDIQVDLDSGTATYLFKHHGAVKGTYLGPFRFRCSLSPIQFIEADKDYRDLLGPNASLASTHADNIAYALAQLRQRVIEAPPFWNEKGGRYGGSHIEDHEVLEILLEAAVKAELKYRKELAARHEKALDQIRKVFEKRQAETEEETVSSKSEDKA